MSKFNFELDTVLNYKKQSESNKMNQLMNEINNLNLKKEDLDDIENKIKNSFQDFRGVLSDNKQNIAQISKSISIANSNYVTGYKNHNENLGKVIQLLELLFHVLINKRLGGYNKDDINNFKDAISQIRQT